MDEILRLRLRMTRLSVVGCTGKYARRTPKISIVNLPRAMRGLTLVVTLTLAITEVWYLPATAEPAAQASPTAGTPVARDGVAFSGS
ncbi:MAG: hypothetical protein M3Q50_02580 [Chloroflexota bacterium]|nr:hypothetical protein [Chloroflexota bacterium]